ncbi:MAG: TetR/AcrR family transcriptional regulator [Christensenellaceae bacterium]|jgi:AcrR family transcriptional regulator
MTEHTLGTKYPLTKADSSSKTKERILLNATTEFAKRGYDAVSMKEIADASGIKVASLYNHFTGKEELMDAVLSRVEYLYMLYFKRLDAARDTVDSFPALVDSMFVELKNVVDIFTYYAFSLVQTEQFNNERAGQIYNDVFLEYSINYIKNRFDESVDNGWAQPFDTKMMATLLMHSVLIGMNVRVQADFGRHVAYDVTDMFAELQKYIVDNVRQ